LFTAEHLCQSRDVPLRFFSYGSGAREHRRGERPSPS
jgi:hypothetical protein